MAGFAAQLSRPAGGSPVKQRHAATSSICSPRLAAGDTAALVLALPTTRHSGRQLRLSVTAGTPNGGDQLVASTDGRVGRGLKGRRRRAGGRGGRGRPRQPLIELVEGQELVGTVRVILDGAVLLKTRAETDALLTEAEAGGLDLSALPRGAQLLTHIKQVDAEKDVLRVTMKAGGRRMGTSPRKDVQAALKEGQRLSGTVKKVRQERTPDGWVVTTGTFVDVGAQMDAFVEGDGAGLPPVGRAVEVVVAPGALDPSELKVRRRILALLPDKGSQAAAAAAAAGAAAAAAVAATSDVEGDDEDKDYYDEEEDDVYDKYGYLDDY
eukprot:jgi/Tetstr1/445894/TSEL_033523.t1